MSHFTWACHTLLEHATLYLSMAHFTWAWRTLLEHGRLYLSMAHFAWAWQTLLEHWRLYLSIGDFILEYGILFLEKVELFILVRGVNTVLKTMQCVFSWFRHGGWERMSSNTYTNTAWHTNYVTEAAHLRQHSACMLNKVNERQAWRTSNLKPMKRPWLTCPLLFVSHVE